MAKNRKSAKKVRNLVVVCALCAILLSVSTYAWFIGMKTVNVTSFEIEIATTEGLFLSMDGENWSYNLDVKGTEAYDKNTNTWAENGLVPVSSIGDMDASVSKMKLYEKGSLTTTKGGYRLLTSRVHNYDETDDNGNIKEAEGYVAFDLFIKNLSGTEYYADNNVLNEEDIFLTTNSTVKVASVGGVENTGIENSVRVAFAQIGRVKATTGDNAETKDTDIANITAITCDDVDAADGQVQVTGICRNAQIWEPNDTKHVQNAINWYDTSCRTRVTGGDDVTKASSYNVNAHCNNVQLVGAVPTYAISRVIDIADNVDIYDGTRYNNYGSNTNTYANYLAAIKDKTGEDLTAAQNDFKLVEFPYFTDTMKSLTGTSRPTFMTLAPNSITKVRVYIYIEGQDVDNYDFASLGKKISVNFGFTKERYNAEDINYQGPAIPATNPTEELSA